MNESAYVGSELDLFARAVNWKHYWSSILRPLLGHRILDVGAGLGATLDMLAAERGRSWLALEPDPGLAMRLRQRVKAQEFVADVEVRTGTTHDIGRKEMFDTILYIDVLEHISDDSGEFARAAAHLALGGRICVLAPAHQWLFTPFDTAIGHERRYARKTLGAMKAPGLCRERLHYLDSVGLIASLGNKLLLRSAQPTQTQIRIWDRMMVPISRVVDPLTGLRLGKSILGVWRREMAP